MNASYFFIQFHNAINWNAAFYGTYKPLVFILSALLYARLDTRFFCEWATINSCVFLLLLWIDFGIKKAIPRYTPLFARCKETHTKFVYATVVFKITILILSLPVFFILMHYYGTHHTTLSLGLLLLISVLYIFQGIASVFETVYHAHFLNKQYNLRSMKVLAATTLTSILATLVIKDNYVLLFILLALRTAGSGAIAILSILNLSELTQSSIFNKQEQVPPHSFYFFIRHCGVMWTTTLIKSFTESNFLIPFILYAFGPFAASSTKIAQDGALFFYRLINKTLGTSDTVLLAHTYLAQDNKDTHQQAIKYLTNKVMWLCIPMFIPIGVGFLYARISYTATIAQLFIILAISYVIEVLLSPAKRVLEVEHKYKKLIIIYIPYAIILAYMFYIAYTGDNADLVPFIIYLQAARLMSALLAWV